MDFPNDFAVPRVQTIHLTASALPVNFSGLDDQCRSRTAALLGVEGKIRVNQFILTAPEQLAGRFLKAPDTLPSLRLIQPHIGQVNPALDHDWACPTRPHRRAPAKLQSLVRKSSQNAGFVPDVVAVRPAPLRPVRCAHRCGTGEIKASKVARPIL